MQISYHSTLTKIQKLQNLKKKIKKNCTGRYFPKLAGMAGTWLVRLVFKPVQNVNVSIPVYIPIWYIPVGTSTVLTTLFQILCLLLPNVPTLVWSKLHIVFITL